MAEKVAMTSGVRETYMHLYPTDELGVGVDPGVTFGDVLGAMAKGDDFYGIVKVGDSTIRERVFEMIAEASGHSYGCVYDLWVSHGTDNVFGDVLRQENRNQHARDGQTIRERSKDMSDEGKTGMTSDWTNFKFFNRGQVTLKQEESRRTGKPYYVAICHFLPGSVTNGIDLGDQNGISGYMRVLLSPKQYERALSQQANGEQVGIGLPSSQLDEDGKVTVRFYDKENPEASHELKINPLAASKANKEGKEAFKARMEHPAPGQETKDALAAKAAEIAQMKSGDAVTRGEVARTAGDVR